jgi:hypothetical protein
LRDGEDPKTAFPKVPIYRIISQGCSTLSIEFQG